MRLILKITLSHLLQRSGAEVPRVEKETKERKSRFIALEKQGLFTECLPQACQTGGRGLLSQETQLPAFAKAPLPIT